MIWESRAREKPAKVVLGGANKWQGRAKLEYVHIYSCQVRNQRTAYEDPMAFKPNYGRDRAERQRAARARTEEKQRRRDEKVALRKAEREATEAPPDDKQTSG